MRVLLRGLGVAAMLLVGACGILALRLEKPEVSVSDIMLIPGGSMLEQRLRLTLRVSNPNDKDITIEGMSFRFEVNDQEVAKGLTSQRAVLLRLSESTIPVDVTASMVELLRQAPKVLDHQNGGKLAYRVRGDIVTRDYGRIPFDRKGEVSLDSLASKAAGAGGMRGQF